MTNLANVNPALWAKTHFSDAFATDVRRKRRIVKVAEALARLPGKSIPQLCETQYDVKATYELLKHPESTPKKLQRGHVHLTHENLHNENGTYLLIEDSTDVIFSGLRNVQGLGPVGKADSVLKGFLLHTVLAVKCSQSNVEDRFGKRAPVEIIGIADQQFHVRQPKKTLHKSRQFVTRARESDLWLNSQKSIGRGPENKDITWIHVSDRAADIYEYLMDSTNSNRKYIVRAQHDRVLVNGSANEKTLFEYARNLRVRGVLELDLRGRPGQSARTVELSICYGKVDIRAPQRPGFQAGSLQPLQSTVIYVCEKSPISKDPLEWIILTNLDVTNCKEACQIIEWYSTRWIIEDYHKALKSGMKSEELQLDTQHSLFAAISIMAVAALRLVELREIIRLRSAAPSEELGLDPIELSLLKKISKNKLETVKDAGMTLGRLGGHLGRKSDGYPGMVTLWKGYTRLRDMAEGVKLMKFK